MRYNKLNWLWLLLLVPVVALVICIICYHNQLDVNTLINAIVGGVSYMGAAALGFVAYWQTRTANDISQVQLRREVISNIIPKSQAEFIAQLISPHNVIYYTEYCDVEGVYCSQKKLIDFKKDEEDIFFEFIFHFDVENAPLEKIEIKDVSINKQFKNTDAKDYCVSYNILNIKNDVVFCYNPKTKDYCFIVYIHDSSDLLENIAENTAFVVDITFNAISIYGIEQQYNMLITIKNEQLDFNKKRSDIGKNSDLEIDDVIIHKNKPNYKFTKR